jgi:FAD:protein FMN transferase
VSGVRCLVAFLIAGASLAHAQETVIEGRAMGMPYRVTIVRQLEKEDLENVRKAVLRELNVAEMTFSLYRTDSEIARWNASRSTNWIPASMPFVALVDYARKVSTASNGAFDPTIRPISKLWRFERVDRDWQPPTQSQLAEALRYVGMQQVHVRHDPPAIKKDLPEVELDLNALVEGWCLDRIAESLRELGEVHFLVHLGGEYLGRGMNSRGVPWTIAIESPTTNRQDNPHETPQAYVKLVDRSVSTSGTYRSGHYHDGCWYGHLLDARTGYPISQVRRLASVVSESALEADGWATALLTMDIADSLQVSDELGLASLVVCDDDQRLVYTRSKQGELTFQSKELAGENRFIAPGAQGFLAILPTLVGRGLPIMVCLFAVIILFWRRNAARRNLP